MKILGGQVSFDPVNRDHAFAVLASRICLDACTNSDECTKLVSTAVNSHLRLVVGMDEEHSVFKTITPSEPVVAHTAAGLLMDSGSPAQTWATAISTLTTALLQPGLIDKGLKRELFARIICILSRDFHLNQSLVVGPHDSGGDD